MESMSIGKVWIWLSALKIIPMLLIDFHLANFGLRNVCSWPIPAIRTSPHPANLAMLQFLPNGRLIRSVRQPYQNFGALVWALQI